MDYNCKLHQGVAAEDGIVWLVDVHYIEGYCFCSLRDPFAERDVELYLAEGLDSLASEANERVLRFLQSLLCEPILTKHCHTRMSAELPLSTKILPTSFPAKCTEFLPMLALMTRGSL